MNPKTPLTFARIALTLLAFLLLTAPVRARQAEERKADPAPASRPHPTAPPAGPERTSPSAGGAPGVDAAHVEEAGSGKVDQLQRKLAELQMIIEQQQLSLAEIKRQLDEIRGKPTLPSVAAAGGSQLGGAAGPPPSTPAAPLATVPGAPAGARADRQTPMPTPQQTPGQTQPIVGIIAGWNGQHAFLRSVDGSFETNLNGYAQFDTRTYSGGNHPADTFAIRRARLALDGKLFRYFDYRIEGDFADTSSTLLRDLYVRIHRIDEVQATFGHFKEPYSQEELRTDLYGDFVERSLVNNLVPSRSPGFMVSGTISAGVFDYQIGAFNGKGLLALNNSNTPEGDLRLRFRPWNNTNSFWLKGLAVGGAYAQGRSLGGTSVRGLTESRSFTFFAPDTVNGKIIRANGEMTWLLGPAALRAEYDQTNQWRDNLGPKGTNLPGVVAKGSMAQFTYLVTGETKPDAGMVIPKHNLFGGESGRVGLGAWELKFRFADLQIADTTAKTNRADTIYFGVNWYFNRFVRYMLDVGVERFKNPLLVPNPGSHDFFVVLNRVQFAF